MELIKKLEAFGYKVFLKEDRICYEFSGMGEPDPKVVTPLLLKLKEHKKEIVDYLKFSGANMAIKVKSRLLDKETYLVSNEEARNKVASEGLVAYLPHELKHLINTGATPEEVRKIHLVKETFPGSKIVWN